MSFNRLNYDTCAYKQMLLLLKNKLLKENVDVKLYLKMQKSLRLDIILLNLRIKKNT